MVKVSVIMPVYNSEDYLEKTCSSLFKQTLKDIELICVNDGSTDKSSDILKKLKKEHESIKIFNQENQGSGKARNKGLDEATGEYIAFLDADDVFIDEDALEKMYNYGKKHDADMVCANLQRISSNGKIATNFNYEEGNYAYFNDYSMISSEEYGIPWAFYKNIYKTSFLNKNNIRFPDLKRGQDPVFLAEILTKTSQLYGVGTNLYGYNYESDGGANSKVNDYTKKLDYMIHFKDTFEVLEKGDLDDLSSRYKERLIIYLSLHNNRRDKELLEIAHKVFEDDNEVYLDRFDDEMLYLELCLVNFKNNTTYTQSMQKIKSKFYEMTILKNKFIDPNIIEKYLEVTKKNQEYGYTTKTEDLYIYQLKTEFEQSNTWKLSKPVRVTKKVGRKVLKKIKNKLVRIW